MSHIDHHIARLNVGGKIFALPWNILLRKFCSTRLYYIYKANSVDEILKYCDDYNYEAEEYFFDRHPDSFMTVLHWIKFGVLYYQSPLCVMSLLDDFKYWGVDHNLMKQCCKMQFRSNFDESIEECEKILAICNSRLNYPTVDLTSKWQRCRSQVWTFTEDPKSSMAAKITTIVSVFFIIISTVTLVVSTVPVKVIRKLTNDSNNGSLVMIRLDEQSGGLTEMIEHICIFWFTVEFLVRLFCCPNLRKFLFAFMNIIDIIAVAPFYLCLLMNFVIVNKTMSAKLDSIRQMMQLFRVLRILRILKFARHSVGLQSLGFTLKKSYNELGMMMMFIGLGSMIFSSLVYFVERDIVGTAFTNVLVTNWWAIISMTTVGYGDMSPESVMGKIVGAFCCTFGVLIISLPIPIIVSNFEEFYLEKSRKENTIRKTEEYEKAMASGCLVLENDNIRSSSFLAEERRKEKLEAFWREVDTIKYIDDEDNDY